MHIIDVRSSSRTGMINITEKVQQVVAKSGIKSGVCTIYVPHTTAGITINENSDPDVVSDMLMELNKIVPFDDGYAHYEGNSAAHIKASMMGLSQQIIVEDGRLVLGTWQTVYFCEFDGPRERKVYIKIN